MADPAPPPLVVNDSDSKGQKTAQRFAKKLLRAKNKHAHRSHLTVYFDPTLCAGQTVSLQGIGGDFDGNWIIEDATHSIANGETELELHKVLDPSYDDDN